MELTNLPYSALDFDKESPAAGTDVAEVQFEPDGLAKYLCD